MILNILKKLFIIIIIVCVCVNDGCLSHDCVPWHMTEDNFVELSLSFHFWVGFRDRI